MKAEKELLPSAAQLPGARGDSSRNHDLVRRTCWRSPQGPGALDSSCENLIPLCSCLPVHLLPPNPLHQECTWSPAHGDCRGQRPWSCWELHVHTCIQASVGGAAVFLPDPSYLDHSGPLRHFPGTGVLEAHSFLVAEIAGRKLRHCPCPSWRTEPKKGTQGAGAQGRTGTRGRPEGS